MRHVILQSACVLDVFLHYDNSSLVCPPYPQKQLHSQATPKNGSMKTTRIGGRLMRQTAMRRDARRATWTTTTASASWDARGVGEQTDGRCRHATTPRPLIRRSKARASLVSCTRRHRRPSGGANKLRRRARADRRARCRRTRIPRRLTMHVDHQRRRRDRLYDRHHRDPHLTSKQKSKMLIVTQNRLLWNREDVIASEV